jgi:hypothetical protein
VLYTIGSGLIYQGAVNVYLLMVEASGSQSAVGLYLGALPGAIGGLGLAVLTKLLSATPIRLIDEGRTATIGAFTGAIFTLVLFMQPEFVFGVLAYAIWQIPVGWSLSLSLPERETPAAQQEPATPSNVRA